MITMSNDIDPAAFLSEEGDRKQQIGSVRIVQHIVVQPSLGQGGDVMQNRRSI